jgi:tRNA-modifying protein YgfZ
MKRSEETVEHQLLDVANDHAVWIPREQAGVLRLTGSDRADLLHRLTTNDCTVLEPGRGVTTVLLTEKARIIDVVTVVDNGESSLILTSEGTQSTMVAWLRKYVIMDDVKVADVTTEFDNIDIIGPRSASVIKDILDIDVLSLGRSHWVHSKEHDVTIVRLPSQSRLIYRILGPVASVRAVTDTLEQQAEMVPLIDAIEDEHLRIMAGEGRIGHEWTSDYNPLEAGLLHLTSFTKGCYIGQEVVARLDSYNKVKQRVMGLVGDDAIEQRDPITADDTVIGAVTSVAHENTVVLVEHRSRTSPFTLHLPPLGP